eukprot:4819913-Pyramimonas_sp.AAC.2
MATSLRSISLRASVSAPQKVSIRTSKFAAAPVRPVRQGDELKTEFVGSSPLSSGLCAAFAGTPQWETHLLSTYCSLHAVGD